MAYHLLSQYEPPIGKSVVLALSGGGVAAVGHIPVLAVLEEFGVRPDVISGTSMGAVIAACFGAGMSAGDLEEYVRSVAREPAKRSLRFLDTGWNSVLTGALDAEHVLGSLLPIELPETLSKMNTSVKIVATDLQAREPVVFQSENTLKALSASIAIPGVFKPVIWDGRIFVDGGVTNNLPVDVLPSADITIAVDTGSFPAKVDQNSLSTLNVLTDSIRIMMQTMTQVRLNQTKNLVLLKPATRAIRALDLHRMEEALDSVNKEKDKFRRQLHEALDIA